MPRNSEYFAKIRKKYLHQRLMVLIIDAYAYLIPYIVDKETFVLKTIIPSRKATKRYIKQKKEGTV